MCRYDLSCLDFVVDKVGNGSSTFSFGAEQVTRGQVSPSLAFLKERALGAFTCTGTSQNKDDLTRRKLLFLFLLLL